MEVASRSSALPRRKSRGAGRVVLAARVAEARAPGSAHDETVLEALKAAAQQRIAAEHLGEEVPAGHVFAQPWPADPKDKPGRVIGFGAGRPALEICQDRQLSQIEGRVEEKEWSLMFIRRRLLAGSLASAAIAMAAATATMTPAAHASTRLGGVSVAGACANQWQDSTVALIANNVFGWKCQYWSTLGPVYEGINLTLQCSVQYGSGAYAAYSNYNNPYSWSCYR